MLCMCKVLYMWAECQLRQEWGVRLPIAGVIGSWKLDINAGH